jgi:hypothetical protein
VNKTLAPNAPREVLTKRLEGELESEIDIGWVSSAVLERRRRAAEYTNGRKEC